MWIVPASIEYKFTVLVRFNSVSGSISDKTCFIHDLCSHFETPTSFFYCASYVGTNMNWGEFRMSEDVVLSK